MRKYNFISFSALSATIVITIQIIYSLINNGSSICPNEGCEIIKQFASLPPLYFNILAIIYFQIVFWSVRLLKNQFLNSFGLLLLLGLVFESILLAYQIFVGQTICSYCIVIFLFVLILNISYNNKQLIYGVSIIGIILFAFSILTFLPPENSSQFYSLKNGSYGFKSYKNPSKKIYLIFSSDCPHCVNVIETLKNCNNCEFYLNPIDKIDTLKIDGLVLNNSYSIEINRLILNILEIKEIPVLIVKELSGFSFIKGERNILNYIDSTCFDQTPIKFYDSTSGTSDGDTTISIEDDISCLIDINCDN